MTPPDFADIEAAAERLRDQAVVTPLLESHALNERVGRRVLIKAESLQRTGSFKFRGAFSRISRIPEADRAAGVVAFSSGNHAQGVAAAAAILGLPATIVMPSDAPRTKMESTRGWGAEIVETDRHKDDRAAVAERVRAERGATLVSPYDDPDVIAGQGTCGLEIARQASAMGATIDDLLVCAGGGGLAAGCALAFATLSPKTRVHAVEPDGYDSTGRSLRAGERLGNPGGARSICDALLSPMPGVLTFAVNRERLSGGLAVSDDEVRAAMAFAFRHLKLVVEPGGAVCLAALLAGKAEATGRTVAITLSGGNVDPGPFADAIGARA